MKKTRHVFKANAFEVAVQLLAAVAAGAAGLVSMEFTAPLPQLVALSVMALTVYLTANGLYLLLDQAVGGIRERLHRAAGCGCQD